MSVSLSGWNTYTELMFLLSNFSIVEWELGIDSYLNLD